jgi:ATP-dependent RNA helicase RhlE
VATPGRLLDLMQQGFIDLSTIKYFVLDEADRMLDSGFLHDVKRIITRLPVKRQTLLFSATLPSEIKQLSQKILHQPEYAEVNPVASVASIIKQSVYHVEKHHKQSLLIDILKDKSLQSVLIFTQMKHHADKLAKSLLKSGIVTQAIHGNKSQSQRQNALENFKMGKTRVLIATDIVARGIDIDELSHVINYELPNVAETYVHRIGRTGRAGSAGTAISFCSSEEKIFLKDIQKLIKQPISVVPNHRFNIMASGN